MVHTSHESRILTTRVVLVFLVALLIAMWFGAMPGRVYAQNPDFSTINDPLDREYELFTVDDLLIFRTTPLDNDTKSQADIYLLDTADQKINSQNKRTIVEPPCYLTDGRQPQVSRIGRFFELDHDVVVTWSASENAGGADCASTNNDSNMGLYTIDPETNDPAVWTHRFGTATGTALAMDDFNLDGLDDLLIFSEVDVFAATDALAVILDPLNSRQHVIGVPVSPGQCISAVRGWGVALAAGDFAQDGSDGLLTANLAGATQFCSLFAYWWEFNGDFSVVGGKEIEYIEPPGMNYPLDIYAATARLDWFADGEQVVLGVGNQVSSGCNTNAYHRQEIVVVITFDENKMTAVDTATTDSTCMNDDNVVFGQYPWLNGMAVGRFASVPDNPTSNTQFNQQIATLRNDGVVHIYSVDPPSDYTPKLVSTTTLESSLGLTERYSEGGTNQINWLVAGDTQGRSLRLGAPKIARITSHSEPTVILGHPPMHADYILPDESTAMTETVVNFSVVPNTYYSQYNTEVSDSAQSSHTHTTSNSYGYSESVSEKFKVNVPLVSSLQGSFTQSWQQQYSSSTTNNNYSYSSQSFDSSTNTGFGDQIWLNQYDFNIYFYPVLGQTVCPNDQPNCSASEEEPLYVQFSGPSDAKSLSVSGARTEWYQPVHEPGQVFSFPSSYAKLQGRYPGLIPLTGTSPTGFFTDDSPTTESANWSGQSGSSVSSGTSRTHSFESDNSITVGPPKLETLTGSGAQVSGSFDYNNSSASSTLNTTATSVGKSTGIGIAKPGSFRSPGLYEYLVEPFIIGQPNPSGTVQSIALTSTVKTTGPIHAAFAANPLNDEAGTWWQGGPYGQYIDVALNHPQRWAKSSQSNVNNPGLNCLQAGTGTVNCVTFNEPEPNDLWNSEFYMMRGLIVTVDGFGGPQRATATVGDDIFLQARVYNYSLVDMPTGSKVYIRFYRQEVVNTVPTGDSVLITETTLDPLPGFDSQTVPNSENWATANTSFAATEDMADKYYLFWVVVWAEDGSNNHIDDLPGHGLTMIPQALISIGDVSVEPYSNNVGYLHMPFYVASQQTAEVKDSHALSPEHVLSIENFALHREEPANGPLELEERVLLSADILSRSGKTEGALVFFYEGEHEIGGTAYDVEVVPHIRSDGGFHVRVPYRPTTCGDQQITIRVSGQ